MAGLSWFAPPAPVRWSARSRRSAEDMAAWFRGAIAQGRVSEPAETSPFVISLRGTVRPSAVRVECRFRRADGAPARPPLPLTVRGTIQGEAAGGRLDVVITPRGSGTIVVFVGVTLLVIAFALSGGPGWAGLLFVLPMAAAWLVVRAAQRDSLRLAPQVEAFLEILARGD